jgi:uncharacterized protein (DUF2249 family)/hemerythrin-like domain-containing protein
MRGNLAGWLSVWTVRTTHASYPAPVALLWAVERRHKTTMPLLCRFAHTPSPPSRRRRRREAQRLRTADRKDDTMSASTNSTPSGTPTTDRTQVLTDAIRAHHRTLAETLDEYAAEVEAGVTKLDAASLAELLDGLTAFLTGELLPHAAGEERALYPALDPVIREHGSPTATMRIDHEYIGDYTRQIGTTTRRLHTASESERPALAHQFARQVTQLQGLFAVHLAKEERVYLPLVEQAIPTDDQQGLLAALHEEATGATTTEELAPETLDVRHLAPAQRHQVIFQRFEGLPVSDSFILVNDHDPKPLYYQLSAEYAGELLWQYLEQGPEVWRVRMGKAR